MAVDPNVFNNIHNFQDYNIANQTFMAQQQAAQIDAATKQNVLKAQIVGAGAGSGNQDTYTKSLQQGASLGLDMSDVPADINGGVGYANAAINAQKPYALGNAQIKAIGANAAGISALGSQPDAAAAGLQVNVPTGAIPPVGGALPQIAPTIQQATTQPPSAFTQANVAPQALPNVPSVVKNPQPNATAGSGALLADMNGGTGDAPAAPLANTTLPAPNAVPPQPVKQSLESPANFNARLSAWQALPEVKAADAGATTAATSAAESANKRKDQALGNQDIIRLYTKIGQEAPSVPGGVVQNVGANLANAANVPSDAANNRGTFDADINNLFMATIRSLAGTGKVQRTELQQMEGALPKQNDPSGVKISKANAHLDDYNHRMVDMGFDPSTGQPLQAGQQPQMVPPIPIPGKAGAGKVVNYTIQNGQLVAQ